ncbi:MAG: glutamate--tRNA ligase [Pseudomonadota bacterium]
MKVRFAPSPTGALHVGNARVALLNWLWARQQGGTFLLRLDDTDQDRSTQSFADDIEADLKWLELDWDEFARQSDRLDRYSQAIERLKTSGRLYACYETPEELELKRKLQLKSGRPPIYDREGLALSVAQQKAYEDEGRRPHWRFFLDHAPIEWEDAVRGSQHFEGGKLSDPVLLREDGRPLYTLSSVVDDLELGITHVLRGEDHVANTAVQIQLFQALGGVVPIFAHLPLLTGAQGQGLSKRLGSLSLAQLRQDGLEAMALNAYLARLGTPDPVESGQTPSDLIPGFDISRYGRATPRFDPDELQTLNSRILHEMPFSRIAEWVKQQTGPDFTEDLWLAIRGNLETRKDALTWYRICQNEISPVVEDAAFLETARELLPPVPWDLSTWSIWTQAVKEKTGRKGKALFMPLRLALTGLSSGPELKNLLPLIGYERVAKRLEGQTA